MNSLYINDLIHSYSDLKHTVHTYSKVNLNQIYRDIAKPLKCHTYCLIKLGKLNET